MNLLVRNNCESLDDSENFDGKSHSNSKGI